MTSADIAAIDCQRQCEAWRGRGEPVSVGPSPLAKGAGRRESHWSATVRTGAERQGSGERVGRAPAKEGKSGETSPGESNAGEKT